MAENERPDCSRITPIAEEHKPLAHQVLDEWIENYHRTDRAQRSVAEEGVIGCYTKGLCTPPKTITWHESPKSALLYVAQKYFNTDKLTTKIVDETFAGVCYGPEDVVWLAAFDFFSRIGQFDLNQIECIYQIARNGHIWFALEDEALMIERPTRIVTDRTTLRAHATDGPVLAYSDGFEVYALENIRVPKKVVMDPQNLTVEEVTAESNAEVRRLMIQQMGLKKFLTLSKAKTLDYDGGPVGEGGAPRALVEDLFGQRWMIGTDGSTERVYYIPVHLDAKTCREAHERISGISEANLIAEC